MTGVCTSLCQTNFDLLSEKWLDRLIEMGVMYTWFHIYRPVGPDAKPELALTPEQQLECRRFVVEMRAKKPIIIVDAYYDGEGRACAPPPPASRTTSAPGATSSPARSSSSQRNRFTTSGRSNRFFGSRRSCATFAKRPPSTRAAASSWSGPTCCEQLVERHGAKDTTARHAAGAELAAMELRPSQYNPGYEIPEKSLAYRIAKHFFFNDYGTYGRHFDASKWIDTRQPPREQNLVQIQTSP